MSGDWSVLKRLPDDSTAEKRPKYAKQVYFIKTCQLRFSTSPCLGGGGTGRNERIELLAAGCSFRVLEK